MAETFLSAREIWYTNMYLLGFRSSLYAGNYKVLFEKDMFVHINKKGSEIVLQFLFSKLDSHCAYESFRDCWPVFDKKQEQQFRKACCNWITRLSKDDPLSKLPLMPASLLLSPGGNKFYQFILRLSSYILRTMCLEEAKTVAMSVFLSSFVTSGKGFMELNASQKQVAHYAIQAIVRHSNSIQQRSQLTCALHKKWEEYANQLIRQYRELTKKSRSIAKKLPALEEEKKILLLSICQDATFCSGPINERVLAANSDVMDRQKHSRMTKVLEMWKFLEKFIQSSEVRTEMVDCIVQGKVNQYAISAKDITVQIPAVVAKEYECLSRERELSTTYQDGKVHLLGLIQVWKCSLRLLKRELLKGSDGVLLFAEELGYTAGELQAHRAHLSSARNLRTSLSILMTSLEQSIKQLEEVDSRKHSPIPHGSSLMDNGGMTSTLPTNDHSSSYTVPKFFVPNITLPTLDLGLIPPTPKRHNLKTPDTPLSRLSLTTHDVSTPFAVEDLSYSILQDSRLKQKKLNVPIPVSSSIPGGLLGFKSYVTQSKLRSSTSGSHLQMRMELQSRVSSGAGHSLGMGVSMGGVPGRDDLFKGRTSMSGSLGKSTTVFRTPSRSDKKQRELSSVTTASFKSGHHTDTCTLPSTGGASTPLNLSSTAHPMGTTPQLWDTSHSEATTPNLGNTISELWENATQASIKGATSSQQGDGREGRAMKSIPPAHEILANQIVAAVCWSESEDSFQSDVDNALPGKLHSVTDTVAALGSNAFFSREVIPRTPVPPSINLLMNRRGGGELISELEMNSSSTLLGGGGQEQISKERGGDLDVASELEPVFLIPSYDAAGLVSLSGSDTSSICLVSMSGSDTGSPGLVSGSDTGSPGLVSGSDDSNWLVSVTGFNSPN